MPDISMCTLADCPSAKKCYRFMARPDPKWQSYSAFDPKGGEKCGNFLAYFEPDRADELPPRAPKKGRQK